MAQPRVRLRLSPQVTCAGGTTPIRPRHPSRSTGGGSGGSKASEQRIAAALAAIATVVNETNASLLTVIADQDGNIGVVCVDMSAAKKDRIQLGGALPAAVH